MTKYEKTNAPNIVVDTSTGALLNNDMGAFAAVKKAREDKKKAAEVQDTVMRLENALSELRDDFNRLERFLESKGVI